MNRIALLQLTSARKVEQNLAQVSLAFQQAHESGVKLIVLPENFAFMGLLSDSIEEIAEIEGDGKIQCCVSELAKRFGLWVIAGTIPLRKKNSSKVRASSIVFDHQGKQVAIYDKIHLFDVQVPGGEVHKESQKIAAGSSVTVVDTPVGRIGLSVCYDVRFPELYRQFVLKGAEVFTVPAAFTAITGAAHWEVLLRARAIENLCYVLAPNQCGHHENGRHTYGHSMVIGPWGEILAQAHDKPDLVIAEIDVSYLKTLRQQFPCNEHHIMA